jgi:hypothetical protein
MNVENKRASPAALIRVTKTSLKADPMKLELKTPGVVGNVLEPVCPAMVEAPLASTSTAYADSQEAPPR